MQDSARNVRRALADDGLMDMNSPCLSPDARLLLRVTRIIKEESAFC